MRDEEANASLLGRVEEDVEERRAEPAALHRVGHRDRDLGRVGPAGQADEARDTDEVTAAIERDHRDVVLAVDGREIRQHRRREVREVREKPLVARLRSEPVERGAQRGGVLRTDESQHDRLAADHAIGPETWSYLHPPIMVPACFVRVSL